MCDADPGGSVWIPAVRRGWCLPTCATATAVPAWPPDSEFHAAPPGATPRKRWIFPEPWPMTSSQQVNASRLAYAIFDGTLVPIGRVADQKPC
ncbi:hypothetical protein GCM10010428_22840 [Actinosynnema pretiosum subsp. pretiosum]